MIKANAGPLAIFGLSDINMQKLMEGKPIKIQMEDLGYTGDPRVIIIMYGKTEAALTQELQPYIGPNTKIRDDS